MEFFGLAFVFGAHSVAMVQPCQRKCVENSEYGLWFPYYFLHLIYSVFITKFVSNSNESQINKHKVKFRMCAQTMYNDYSWIILHPPKTFRHSTLDFSFQMYRDDCKLSEHSVMNPLMLVMAIVAGKWMPHSNWIHKVRWWCKLSTHYCCPCKSLSQMFDSLMFVNFVVIKMRLCNIFSLCSFESLLTFYTSRPFLLISVLNVCLFNDWQQ